jgi:alpha-ketoglutarate-dependent taurine dioxygenase
MPETQTVAAVTALQTGASIGPRLSPAGGVAIIGIDLAQSLSPQVREGVLAAFREHHVLVFRNQDLSNDEQLAFTRQFGKSRSMSGAIRRPRATASSTWSPMSATTAS